jgi:outer membrane lipoprotein-sorting protein
MRRKAWAVVILMIVLILLAGCGPKSAEEVVNDLSERSEDLKSYRSQAKMTIQTGSKPQEYDVEVWYKQPHYYRVSLKNVNKDITQILLRNDDGVYVLTPHLNKSFRFHSDWPESSGQVYLYQTLLNSIIDDSARQFTAGKEDYRFEVAAKFEQNQSLVKQRIWLDRKLNPQKVEVLDSDDQVKVLVEFSRFEPDVSFDKDAFDMERNMTGYGDPTIIPSSGQEEKKGEEKAEGKGKDEKEFSALTPGWIPEGSRLVDQQTVNSPEGKVVILRYQGDPSFTLSQKRPEAVQASLPIYGRPLDLGFTQGILLETDENKRLSWTYEGTDFELVGDLPVDVMSRIARSIEEQPAK